MSEAVWSPWVCPALGGIETVAGTVAPGSWLWRGARRAGPLWRGAGLNPCKVACQPDLCTLGLGDCFMTRTTIQTGSS